MKTLVLSMGCLTAFCLVALYKNVSEHHDEGAVVAYGVIFIASLMAWAGYFDLRFGERYKELNQD